MWVVAIFTTVELSTVIDQDPHDFRDRCTVIQTRPARGEFMDPFRLSGAFGRFVSAVHMGAGCRFFTCLGIAGPQGLRERCSEGGWRPWPEASHTNRRPPPEGDRADR
jgi:hypothetical protein